MHLGSLAWLHWVVCGQPSLSYLPPSPPPVGLSLHQSSLDLSLQGPGSQEAETSSLLKVGWEHGDITSTSSLLSAGTGQPRFKGWKSRFPLFVEMDRPRKEGLVATLCWKQAPELLLGPRKGRKRKTSQLLLLCS